MTASVTVRQQPQQQVKLPFYIYAGAWLAAVTLPTIYVLTLVIVHRLSDVHVCR